MSYTTIVVKGRVRIEAGDTFKGCRVVEVAGGNALTELEQAENALRCAYNDAGGSSESTIDNLAEVRRKLAKSHNNV